MRCVRVRACACSRPHTCAALPARIASLFPLQGYSYARTNNPTVTALENKIAELEGGAGATCFGTGMAATISVVSGMMNAGDHCVITNCSYGGTNRACRTMFTDLGMTFDFIDFTELSNIEAHIKPNTRLIFSESPANPTLTLTDIAAVSSLAKSRGIPHVIDSTFATPVIQRPIELGADLVIQSTTKFYDGHNMTVGGAVISATPELHERIKHMQNVHGNIMSPQNAFYTLQTCKTLGLRIERQSSTAQKVAEFLESHAAVDVVRYPGLASFPQKELADRQHKDGLHGAMLWFEVKGGTESGRRLMNSIQRPWSLCENLGAIESICTCPSVMTHANMLSEDRLKVRAGVWRASVCMCVAQWRPLAPHPIPHYPHAHTLTLTGGHHRRLRAHLVRAGGPGGPDTLDEARAGRAALSGGEGGGFT